MAFPNYMESPGLSEEQKRLIAMMRGEQVDYGGGTPLQPGPMQPQPQPPMAQGEIMAPPPQQQSFLTGRDEKELQDVMRQDIPGMAEIQATRTGDPFTALGKTLAAGYVGKKGRKALKEEQSVLRKTRMKDRQAEEDLRLAAVEKEETALARQTAVEDRNYELNKERVGYEADRIKAGKDMSMTDYQKKQIEVATEKNRIAAIKEKNAGLTGEKPTSTIIRHRAEYKGIQRRANNLNEKIGELNAAGIDIKDVDWSIVRSAAQDWTPDLLNLIETKYRDPKVLDVLDELENFSAELLHEKYGGALTGGEQARGKRWDPATTSISDDRTMQRLDIVASLAGDQISDLGAPYEGFDWGDEPTGAPGEEPTTAPAEDSGASYASDEDRISHMRDLKKQGYADDKILEIMDRIYPN